jgi:hypothetical protein
MIDAAVDRDAPARARDARRHGAWSAGGLGRSAVRLLALPTGSARHGPGRGGLHLGTGPAWAGIDRADAGSGAGPTSRGSWADR